MLKLIKNRKNTLKNVHKREEFLDHKLFHETQYLLQIFPEIVWLRISKLLVDQKDIISLSNSSLFFRNLLSHRSVLFLFSDVFQFILPHLVEQPFVAKLYTRTQNTSKPQLSLSILNCRLVCHSWKLAIDELAEKINVNQNWETSPPNNLVTFNNDNALYIFSSVDVTKKFVNKFGGCVGNPILGRTICIKTPPIRSPDDLQAEFYFNILTFLEIFGKYVWNCKFHFSSDLNKDALEYSFLQFVRLLRSLPYLRNLVISNLGAPCRIPRRLQDTPKFQSLESITLRCVSSTFLSRIIVENTQISKLVVNVSFFYLLRGFVNLKELELLQCSWEDFKMVKVFGTPNWQLRKLKLKFCTGVDWSDLLKIISVQFGESLEELKLETIFQETDCETVRKIFKDSKECKLNLQKIRKIHLELSNFSTLNFLLGVKESLESLCISWNCNSNALEYLLDPLWKDFGSKGSIKGSPYKLYKTNIWTLFPKLQTVVVGGRGTYPISYNRREWSRRKNSGIISLIKGRFLKTRKNK